MELGLPSIYITLSSANDMREVVSKLDYIDGFLNKPVDLTKLEKLIKSVIG